MRFGETSFTRQKYDVFVCWLCCVLDWNEIHPKDHICVCISFERYISGAASRVLDDTQPPSYLFDAVLDQDVGWTTADNMMDIDKFLLGLEMPSRVQ